MQDLPNGGGGGRRSKHWTPGAGDPRYATGAPPSHRVKTSGVVPLG